MKNKKIIGLIFVVVAFILIAVGGIGLSKSNKNTNSKNDKSKVEESYADKKTDRNYQATTKVPAGSYISTNKEVIKQTAADIGLKKAICEEKYCSFSNNGYKVDKFQDNFSISFDDDNTVSNVTTMLYYSEKDFSYDKLYEDVNTIVGSYVGLEISKDNLEKMKKPTKNGEVSENNYVDTKFTIQMSLQYIKENGLYVYRNFIIETEKYK